MGFIHCLFLLPLSEDMGVMRLNPLEVVKKLADELDTVVGYLEESEQVDLYKYSEMFRRFKDIIWRYYIKNNICRRQSSELWMERNL